MTTTARTLVIIGAGFAGLCMAIKLKAAGIDDFVVLEAGAGVGGTWRDNTYPGCACDVPSHLYSFSFERRAAWSRKYSGQAEILEYLERCADKYRLRPHLRLNTRAEALRWDAAAGRWWVRTSEGVELSARIVVAGVGGLRVPEIPTIPGRERFSGATFHSARWDHGYALAGKRVAVIGTGASAIQFVPQIADKVAQLSLFQRTPPWILPKPDRAFTGVEKRIFAAAPGIERVYRASIYAQMEATALGFLRFPKILKAAEWLARRHIAAQIEDPALRAAVTPSFAIGCKRILISNDYYPALTRPNVEVVTDPVASIEEAAVVTRSGRRVAVDAIIYGTGFAVRDFLAPMTVVGRDGQELREAWRGGAEAFYGLAVAGFPNFFMIVGPNTGLGHNSMVVMIEAQVRYIRRCVQRILKEGLTALEVLPARQRAFNEGLRGRMRRTVWKSGCQSWYLDDQGENYTLWPGYTWEFVLRTRRPRAADFAAA